jgi:prolyl oligopeptidase
LKKPAVAKKTNFSYKLHGDTIKDPYQWLEDRDDPAVNRWVKAQNKYSESKLIDSKFDAIQKDVAKDMDIDFISTPYYSQGYWYINKRNKTDQKFKYFRMRSLGGKPKLYFDENALAKNISLESMSFSPSRDLMAYELSESGSEQSTIYMKNIKTGKKIKDKITECIHANICWNNTETGFFYSKPDPQEVTKDEPYYNIRLYFHKLGTDYKDDKIIFGEGFDKEYGFSCSTKVESQLLVHAWKGWRDNKLFVLNLETGVSFEILENLKGKKWHFLTKDYVIVATDVGAPKYKIIIAKAKEIYVGNESWTEIIPECDAVLSDFKVTKNAIICIYQKDVSEYIMAYDFRGKLLKKLQLPKYTSILGVLSDSRESKFSYSFENFLQMKTSVLSNSITFEKRIIQKPKKTLSSKHFVVEQCWYKSGKVKVPMYVVRKKNSKLNGKNPTVLYSYGGYGHSELPHYPLRWEKFIKKGGIFVVANIRGGGEFGEDWHRAGSGKDKMNSLYDIIAAAEFLQKEKYTSNEHLAIYGGSNGGMNVLACMVLRPELFGAVIASVPLSDMYRFPKFLMASRWTEEKGDPKVKAEYNQIKKWSPYHNVSSAKKYPPLLIMTGFNDSRVHPMHSWKMTARMQEVSQSVFVYTNLEQGHTIAAAKDQQVFDQALRLRFLEDTIV